MKDLDNLIFINLFKDVCEKCFGHPLETPLSETESKLLSNQIQEGTGLVIGVKSIKNYSLYVLGSPDSKKENPSVATLDTLARYVLDAPYTDEVKRKDNQSHYPFWFLYKSRFAIETPKEKATPSKRRKILIPVSLILILGAILFLFVLNRKPDTVESEKFVDTFGSLDDDSLSKRGWFIQSKDITWWEKRNEKPGYLTLYTLRGNNWPDSVNSSRIKNLLLREISSDCFTAEMRLDNFIPKQNWEQAGIILLEDTTLTGKGIRISIAYNDFFGGYDKSPEIIIQAISSSETGGFSKPEEFAHGTLFTTERENDPLIKANLKTSALKIEKRNNHFRFLYSTGPMENGAFKEIVSRDFSITPKYIGLFAMEGFVNNTDYTPAHISFFSLTPVGCEN